MRFITKPGPARLRNPVTDAPADADVSFNDLLRALFADARVLKQIDVFTAGDARAALLDSAIGEATGISEKVWDVLRGLILPPEGEEPAVTVAVAYSVPQMLRAITDAPTEKPRSAFPQAAE